MKTKTAELLSIKISAETIKIGFSSSISSTKGRKDKITSHFKEEKQKFFFEDDLLVLEESKLFSEEFAQPKIFITNCCNNGYFNPNCKKFIAVKEEFIEDFKKVLFYYFEKRGISTTLKYHSTVRLNRIQRVCFFEMGQISLFRFPKKLDDFDKCKEFIDEYFKNSREEKRYRVVRNGVKTLL